MNSFTKTTDLVHRAMDANTLRYNVAANNLANSGVPNFKRSDINFETELKAGSRLRNRRARTVSACDLRRPPYQIKWRD